MITKTKSYHQVHYAWIDNHQERRAHTVVTAASLEAARQQFQRKNPHVLVVADSRLSGDPAFLVNLRVRLQEQSFATAS